MCSAASAGVTPDWREGRWTKAAPPRRWLCGLSICLAPRLHSPTRLAPPLPVSRVRRRRIWPRLARASNRRGPKGDSRNRRAARGAELQHLQLVAASPPHLVARRRPPPAASRWTSPTASPTQARRRSSALTASSWHAPRATASSYAPPTRWRSSACAAAWTESRPSAGAPTATTCCARCTSVPQSRCFACPTPTGPAPSRRALLALWRRAGRPTASTSCSPPTLACACRCGAWWTSRASTCVAPSTRRRAWHSVQTAACWRWRT